MPPVPSSVCARESSETGRLSPIRKTRPTGTVTSNGAPPATRSVFPKSALYKPGGKLYLYTQQLAAACGSAAPTKACVAAPRPVTPGYAVFSKQFSDAFFGAYKGGNAKDLLDKAAKAIDIDAADNDNYGLN